LAGTNKHILALKQSYISTEIGWGIKTSCLWHHKFFVPNNTRETVSDHTIQGYSVFTICVRFKAAMDEDFGTPEAIAVLFDLAGEVNRSKSVEMASLLKALGGCLGLLQADANAYLQSGAGLDEATIQQRIADRAAAKAAKDFARADEIRKELLAQGIVLKDSAAGTTWEVAQ
jgi:cysteinyl-tRNA synthetase